MYIYTLYIDIYIYTYIYTYKHVYVYDKHIYIYIYHNHIHIYIYYIHVVKCYLRLSPPFFKKPFGRFRRGTGAANRVGRAGEVGQLMGHMGGWNGGVIPYLWNIDLPYGNGYPHRVVPQVGIAFTWCKMKSHFTLVEKGDISN